MGFHLTLGWDIQKPLAPAPLEMLNHQRLGLNLLMAGTDLLVGTTSFSLERWSHRHAYGIVTVNKQDKEQCEPRKARGCQMCCVCIMCMWYVRPSHRVVCQPAAHLLRIAATSCHASPQRHFFQFSPSRLGLSELAVYVACLTLITVAWTLLEHLTKPQFARQETASDRDSLEEKIKSQSHYLNARLAVSNKN